MRKFRTILLIIIVAAAAVGAYKYKMMKKAEIESIGQISSAPIVTEVIDKNKELNKDNLDNINKKTDSPPKELDNKNSNQVTPASAKSLPEVSKKPTKNSNKDNSNAFLSTEKKYNEEIINEMMESRALEVFNLKQHNEIAKLAGGLRKNMYGSISDMLKEDEMLKKLMILGFIQKEFGLNLDPNSYIALEKSYNKEKGKDDLINKYKDKLDNLDKLREDIINEVTKQIQLSQQQDVSSQVASATGVKEADLQIVEKINSFVKNYLDQKLKISGVYKIGDSTHIYAELDNNFFELKKGSPLRSVGEYVSILVYDISDNYARFLIDTKYKTANKKLFHAVPLNVNYINTSYQPNAPNYYIKGDQSDVKGSSSKSTPLANTSSQSNNNLSAAGNIIETAEKYSMPTNRKGYTPQYYTPAGRNRPVMGTSEAMQPRE
jgi:hypothetical protein